MAGIVEASEIGAVPTKPEQEILVRGRLTAPPVEPLAINVDQAAGLIGVSRSMFYELMDAGTIGPMPVKFGPKCCRFPLAELRAWAEAGMPSREQWQKMRTQLTGKISSKGS